MTSEREVFDLLRRGQGVLGAVVAVDAVREDLQGTLRELRPAGESVEYVSGDGQAEVKEG